MRVLYIVTAYPRFEGDIITPWLIETIRRLKEKGIETTILAPSYKGLKNQIIYGIPVQRFRYFFKRWEKLTHEETAPDRVTRSLSYKFLVLFYLIFGTLKVACLCRKEKFDVIHVHWPVPHAIFGYIGKRVSKARLILSFYGVELRWVKKSLPFLASFVKWAINRADLVTCISTHTREELLSFSSRPVTIIPFGAGLDIQEGESPPAHPPEILFVGRLVERKGVKYLIDAYKLLAEKIDCKLYIVGGGPERPALERQVKTLGLQNKVVLSGAISEQELRKRYQNCSVFVLPAITDSKGDTEGLGVVLIEALNYKRPVVASSVGGITDVIIDGKTGLLVPERNSELLAQALLRILEDQNLAKKLGETGYDYCTQHFSWDTIIQRLQDVYNRIIRS